MDIASAGEVLKHHGITPAVPLAGTKKKGGKVKLDYPVLVKPERG